MNKIIKDKMGREIELNIADDFKMTAVYEDTIVGEFDYKRYVYPSGYYDEEEYFELWSMNIKSTYQGLGIGTEMIRFGEERLEKVSYPEDTGSRHGNHLSSEGKSLIDSCIAKGIIEVKTDIEDEYDDDYDEYLLSQIENEEQ